MRIVAINGSPNMGKGNTALILHPFLEGMKDKGAEVDLFYTKKLEINPCQGEFGCWIKTPGKCFQQDDMEILLPLMDQSDVLVLATPIYVDGMTGPMKNLLDRIIPGVQPFMELRDGHCRHPFRQKHKGGKLVLVSTCGYWEKDNFDPLLVHMEAVSKNLGRDFIGALLRPHGPALRSMMKRGMVDDIFEGAREAGGQLVTDGKMSSKTLDLISRELIPVKMYLQIINSEFDKVLERIGEIKFQ